MQGNRAAADDKHAKKHGTKHVHHTHKAHTEGDDEHSGSASETSFSDDLDLSDLSIGGISSDDDDDAAEKA